MKFPDMLIPFKLPIYAIMGILILSLIIWASNSFPRESVLQTILNERESEIRTEYIQKIKDKEVVIADLEVKLQASKRIVDVLNVDIDKLRKAKGKIYEPKTRQETLDRLVGLGYIPIK
jgi:hypothetical protein